ncbi:MAG: right-handed parallel beta-helix repeat-containing protein, partial [Deltaproteobacteria bacterium]|nr:right-handed parallel beta-helix repeat-containing protein [Deltaproteobacteria bacterium]
MALDIFPNSAGKGWLLAIALAALILLAPPAYVHADPDLPGASANTELIPAGSLVIPMDNDKQNIGAAFNLKAYGLVNKLLWDEIPVKWAIRAGKGKDGIDFTAEARRIFPSALTAATLNFRAGPFIVHRNWAGYARSKISAFGNNVAVYELTQDVTVDIRHNLTQKRRVGALNDGGNANIHVGVLSDAGFVSGTHYETIDITTLVTLNGTKCITTATEPHFSAASSAIDQQAQAVRTFVEAGGNFLAQCIATTTYENNVPYGLYQTTNGIVESNLGNSNFLYPNPDIPFSQFDGSLADTGGSVNDFKLNTGSSFRNNGHIHVQDTPLTDTYVATAAKLTGGVGSLVFYLGGHQYGNSAIGDINGQRMYMNAVMTPAVRPSACGFSFVDDPSILRSIAGTVKEDVNGDSNLGDAVPAANVRVRIYADVNANGIVDAGDTFLEETATDGSGAYTFQVSTGANGTKYLVTADSKTISPAAGIKAGFTQGDVWAQQTYGDNPATPALDVGSRFGGRTPGVSDAVSAASTDPSANVYQHVARIDVTSGNVSGVDFGFSFNVVTNVRGGDSADDDGSSNRTVQGSLRQFIQNANAITGGNAMRFVPAVATNGSGGGGSWWQIPVTVLLPAVTDASTTVDGRAYNFSDGTTLRDTNPGTLGTGGTVGVGALALPTVSRPELEIVASGGRAIGLDLQAGSAAVRRLAISGFGTGSNNDGHGNLRVGAFSGASIDNNVIGSSAGSFTDPGLGAKGDGIRVVSGGSATVRSNLIGFAGGNGIGLKGTSSGVLLEGNEIRGNGLNDANLAGVFLDGTSAAVTVRGNLLAGNRGAGVDAVSGTAAHVLENNTATGNGAGATVTAGVRLKESVGARVDRNVIFGNTGAGVMVNQNASGDTITKNSIYGNSAIGIDLVVNNSNTGDGVTLNDLNDADTGGNGRLNYPILEDASVEGGNLVLTGFARPGSVIELFLADPDPTGFGEGKTYLATLTEGSGADLDATTGTYGPGRVNNMLQGTDTTNRFRFVIPLPGGVSYGTWLTATATVAGATSEFGGKVAVGPFSISGTVYEDVNGDADLSDKVARPGVAVHLFRDGGDGLPTGADDVYVISATTDGSGQYTFTSLGQETYWVVADSKTVSPAAGGVQTNVWAQQTYGIAGALCADGSGGTAERTTAGPCYGGRQGGVSDPVFPVPPTPATLAAE